MFHFQKNIDFVVTDFNRKENQYKWNVNRLIQVLTRLTQIPYFANEFSNLKELHSVINDYFFNSVSTDFIKHKLSEEDFEFVFKTFKDLISLISSLYYIDYNKSEEMIIFFKNIKKELESKFIIHF